jgi:hypothetical protein
MQVKETLAPVFAHVNDLTERKQQLLDAEGILGKAEKEARERHAEHKPDTKEQAEDLKRMRETTWRNADIDREIAQLFQMLGEQKYTQAESLMRRYIPKHSFPWSSGRSAAIWALGYFHLGQPDDDLVGQFISRATDNNPLDPEAMNVRQQSAAALARMKATSAVGALQGVMNSNMESQAMMAAARLAVIALTGQELPPMEGFPQLQTGWYVEPHK